MAAPKDEEEVEMQRLEEEEEEEEMEEHVGINDLIDYGINARDVRQLQAAGILSCNDLMNRTKMELATIRGLSMTKVERICEVAEGIGSKKMENLKKTLNTIHRKDILQSFLKDRKRCEDLSTSLMINCPSRILTKPNHMYLIEREEPKTTRSQGQLDRWDSELKYRKGRVTPTSHSDST